MVALVQEDKVTSFISNMKEAYYNKINLTQDKLNSAIFVTKPGAGANIMEIC